VYRNSVTTVGGVGGGVMVASGFARLANTTVSGNSATSAAGVGGRVFNGMGSNAVQVYNSILANNTGSDCYKGSGAATIVVSNSVVRDGTCAVTNGVQGNLVGQDPLLGALANNGGATMTQNLGAVSPALSAGNVGLASFNGIALQYDQRGFGFPRTLAGAIDMGAIQHQGDRIFASGLEAEP
jgi:hypothetical protein